MDTDKLEYYRNLLLYEIAALSVNQTKTVTDLMAEAEPLPDMVDHAASQTDRNFELRIRERERNLIALMEKAILRIDNGAYGICDDCGEDISEKRLIARPVTTYCIDCKTRQEQEEKRRGFAMRPGLRGSLKESLLSGQEFAADFDAEE